VGEPVNVGSGNVAVTVPLFTLAQSPHSLSFGLTYHSGTPLFPGLVPAPLGLGWNHSFAQTLRPTDPSGRVLYHITAEGFESQYTQSGAGVWTASSPGELRGQVTLAAGQYALTDLDGTVTRFNASAVERTSTYTYDGRDRLLKTLLPRGNATAYGYEDGTNRLTDTVRLDAAGNQVERRHVTLDVIGNKGREEDQSCDAPAPVCGSWTTRRSESFTYDLHDRLSAVVHPVPASSRVGYAYDQDGLLATIQDEDHASPNTRYAYDALHHLTSVRQTLAGAPGGVASTLYGYDAQDNLAAVTDPNGNVTHYQYDDFRRLARQDSPVTGTTTYQYDPAGNLTASTDARGATTTRTYDPANRLLAATAQLAGTATETVAYTYDTSGAGNYGKGRLASMTDPSGATTYTYERRGLLKGEAQTILGTAYTTGFRYDANGNRSLLIYPSGRQVTYGFDFADRPVTAAAG